MTQRLRELIRAVRLCKTAAEERAVIAKECALIRTAFKEKEFTSNLSPAEAQLHHRNLAKLLYINMLGYPTHFGQMECVKLIASPRFPEKRIGYLGLMLLLDERQQVLMLVTQCLKNDLQHINPYVQGLALCTLGNIASSDLARDLCLEVEKLLLNANPYIRKKAGLCAIRVIRKCPELMENYIKPAIEALNNEKHHGPMLGTVQLIIEMLKINPKTRKEFRRLVQCLVGNLKKLVLSGYAAEHDVSGITDPFLQVKIIRLLKMLGQGDQEASDEMNDILAQVATNTESTKNPGNAILYECVQTIMSIEAESGLRILAVNILGRFLLNRDNNIRYVALNTLCKIVNVDAAAIQRHRNTVVECLKDADISIRRRALDLIYALVNPNNVCALVRELLNYLVLAFADTEFKTDLTEKICTVVEKFAPSKRWHIDTILQVLESAGNHTRPTVASDLIILISQQKELHAYTVHKVYSMLEKQPAQKLLAQVAIWCIGEYGELLVTPEGAKEAKIDDQVDFASVRDENKVLSALELAVSGPDQNNTTREFFLNCLIKLAVRFNNSTKRIKDLLTSYSTNMSEELQQRAVEYLELIDPKYSDILKRVVSKMPIFDEHAMKKIRARRARESQAALDKEGKVHDDDEDDESEEESEGETGTESEADKPHSPKKSPKKDKKTPTPKPAEAVDSLTQLASRDRSASQQGKAPSSTGLDITFSPAVQPQSAPAVLPTGTASSKHDNTLDILSEIFTAQPQPVAPVPVPAQPVPYMQPVPAPMPSLFQLGPEPVRSPPPAQPMFMPAQSPPMASPPIPSPPPVSAAAAPIPSGPAVVFQKNGLTVQFDFAKGPEPTTTQVTASFINAAPADMQKFEFKIAVPKYIKLALKPPSSATVVKGGPATTQMFLLTNSLKGQKPLVVRMKLDYTINGAPVSEQGQFSSFPEVW